MARTIHVNDVVEVSYRGRHVGQRTLNLLHYKCTAAPIGGVDFAGYADELIVLLNQDDDVSDRYLACCSNEFHLEEIRVQIISEIRYSYESFPQVDTIGTVAEEALPPNEGVTLTKRNDGTGRRNRGSVHMPAVPRTFVSEGVLTGAAVTAYTALGVKLRAIKQPTVLAAAIDLTPVIFNKTTPSTSPPFNSVTVQLTSRTNRRRTVGVGE
jgi:hypothetical protein